MTNGSYVRFFLVGACTVAVLALADCSQEDQRLAIVFSNDMKGEIRSCGCVANDVGGLGRRGTFVSNRRKVNRNLLIVEAGDFFASEINYGKEKASLTLQALSFMDYDGMVVGERDLSFGVDYLLERVEALGLPVVVANLVDGSGKALFPPSRRVETPGGLAVGLIGVIGPELKLPPAVPAGRVTVKNPQEAIRREIAAFGDDVDLIVVLAHMQIGHARRLAQEIPEVDLVFCGHDSRPMRRLRRFGNAYVLQTAGKGRHMGLAYATVSKNGIDELSYNLTALTPEFTDHDAIVKLFRAYDMDIANKEKSHMRVTFSDQPKDRFVGAKACQPCHEEIYEQWSATKHAHAFDILVAEKREFDRDCTPCHTTGFFEIGGFVTVEQTPELIGIQCEMCHGNGARHSADPDVTTGGKAKTVCTNCHTGEQTPGFEFEEYWPKISH